MKLLIINGPNLSSIGNREKSIYGSQSFEVFFDSLKSKYNNVTLEYFQSNSEGAIIDKLWQSEKFNGIILNAGAYTHTSIAIADAVKGIEVPVVEIHISNVFSRESFRYKSFIAPYCKGIITGFGLESYRLAIESFL